MSGQPTDWEKRYVVRLRIIEGVREVGLLVAAFAPLDVALNARPFSESWAMLVLFLVAALLLFSLAVFSERRLLNAE